MTIAAKAERVRKIAALAYAQADENAGIMAFLEWGNRPSVHRLFKPGEAHVPWLIRGALLERLTMALMRLFDALVPQNPQGAPLTSELDSLPVAFALLGDPEVCKAATSPNGANNMATAIALWEPLAGDKRIGRLRGLRNYMMAHTISSKWDFTKPMFSDPLSLARDTAQVIEALALGCGVATAPLKDAAEVWTRLCTDYWVRLVRTPPVQES